MPKRIKKTKMDCKESKIQYDLVPFEIDDEMADDVRECFLAEIVQIEDKVDLDVNKHLHDHNYVIKPKPVRPPLTTKSVKSKSKYKLKESKYEPQEKGKLKEPSSSALHLVRKPGLKLYKVSQSSNFNSKPEYPSIPSPTPTQETVEFDIEQRPDPDTPRPFENFENSSFVRNSNGVEVKSISTTTTTTTTTTTPTTTPTSDIIIIVEEMKHEENQTILVSPPPPVPVPADAEQKTVRKFLGRPCKYFNRPTGCRYTSTTCPYLHEYLDEFYKLEKCRELIKHGFCRYGSECRFTHEMNSKARLSRNHDYLNSLIEAKKNAQVNGVKDDMKQPRSRHVQLDGWDTVSEVQQKKKSINRRQHDQEKAEAPMKSQGVKRKNVDMWDRLFKPSKSVMIMDRHQDRGQEAQENKLINNFGPETRHPLVEKDYASFKTNKDKTSPKASLSLEFGSGPGEDREISQIVTKSTVNINPQCQQNIWDRLFKPSKSVMIMDQDRDQKVQENKLINNSETETRHPLVEKDYASFKTNKDKTSPKASLSLEFGSGPGEDREISQIVTKSTVNINPQCQQNIWDRLFKPSKSVMIMDQDRDQKVQENKLINNSETETRHPLVEKDYASFKTISDNSPKASSSVFEFGSGEDREISQIVTNTTINVSPMSFDDFNWDDALMFAPGSSDEEYQNPQNQDLEADLQTIMTTGTSNEEFQDGQKTYLDLDTDPPFFSSEFTNSKFPLKIGGGNKSKVKVPCVPPLVRLSEVEQAQLDEEEVKLNEMSKEKKLNDLSIQDFLKFLRDEENSNQMEDSSSGCQESLTFNYETPPIESFNEIEIDDDVFWS